MLHRIEAVLDLLQARLPDSQVLLLALLPRHKAGMAPPLAWPNLYTQVSTPRADEMAAERLTAAFLAS